MPEEELKEVLVACPGCRKVHKVSVKEARDNPRVTLDCGTVIGSIGVLRRADEMEERIRKFKSTLHKLE
ncbi:MAG TPA: hypothetical protein VGJ92_14355 [Methanocella sp.]|jgi:hypothetical protein